MEPAKQDRIAAAFERARKEGRAALMPFVMAGDPDAETTARVLEALVEGGADLIELGVPFSDPVADGPAIQASGQRSLAGGFSPRQAFDLVADFRRRDGTPIILFSYVNPILALGTTFAAQAQRAGVDGVIAVDLPFEESQELSNSLHAEGLHLIPLVAPTTAVPRLKRILSASTGFVYAVSLVGVTGSRLTAIETVSKRLSTLRALTDLPVAVGFGVQTAEDVARLAPVADGVVVGSELVRRIHAAGPERAPDAARVFLSALRQATMRQARRA